MSIFNPVSTRVITGEDTRFSYPNVFEPRSINGGEPQYDICLLIPKTDTATVNAIRASMEAAYRSGTGTLQGKGPVPPMDAIRLPLRDGDLERPDDPAYAGCWFMNARADVNHRPGIVDAQAKPIQDRSEFYSGCYGRASVSFFVYNRNGNRGIGCRLNNLQKLRALVSAKRAIPNALLTTTELTGIPHAKTR